MRVAGNSAWRCFASHIVWVVAGGAFVGGAALTAGCSVDNTQHVESKSHEQTTAQAGAMKLVTGFEAGVRSDAWTTVTLPQDYAEMVVVATPVYDGTSAALVPRIRNVTSNSFELQAARFDGIGQPATPITVQWLAVEAGAYSAAEHGVTLEAVRYESTQTDRRKSWKAEERAYLNSYSQPVVLGQVMTANDPSPSVFWSRGSRQSDPPSASTLRVGKHVGEDPNTTRANETVGYIVVEAGQYEIDGVALEAGLGADGVKGITQGSSAYPVAVGGPVLSAVLSQVAMDGGDGSWAVLESVNESDLFVGVDEDLLSDNERNHTGEQIAYLATNPCATSESAGNACGEGGTCTRTGQCVDATDCKSWSTGAGILKANVTVDATDTAGDLAQLDGIWCVSGNLKVTGVDWTDLAPLSGVLGVSGAFELTANPSLTSTEGLDIVSVGQLKLYANANIPDLSGFGKLIEGRSLELAGNRSLTSLDGLGSVDWNSSVWLSGNGALQHLDALSGIQGSLYSLTIQNESSVTNLSGLSGVTSVGGTLRVYNADALTSLQGLDALSSVGGQIHVAENDALSNISALSNLTAAGSTKIVNNPQLGECAVDELAQRTGASCIDCSGNEVCQASGNECAAASCNGALCEVSDAPAGTPCADGTCDGAGQCLGCVTDSDCVEGYCSSTSECVNPVTVVGALDADAYGAWKNGSSLPIRDYKRISDDGLTLIGSEDTGTYSDPIAFRWNESTGLVRLGSLAGGRYESQATAQSADGSIVVGDAWSTNQASEAFTWTSTGTMVSLGAYSSSNQTYAYGINAEGTVVVGCLEDYSGSDWSRQPYSWSVAEGFQIFPKLTSKSACALDVSSDGLLVVGNGETPEGHIEAMLWNGTSAPTRLGTLGGLSLHSEATAISRDGSTIVGWSNLRHNCDGYCSYRVNNMAFRWTEAGGMQTLGAQLGPEQYNGSQATAVSSDGSVIIGSKGLSAWEQFIWFADQDEVIDLRDYMAALGITQPFYAVRIIGAPGNFRIAGVAGTGDGTAELRWMSLERQ